MFTFPNSPVSFCQQLHKGKRFSTHASHHVTAMLSYPDRHKFEQIRARWETAQPSADDTTDMVGRREKQASQQPLEGESQSMGGSKFRRKLSHGLALISNPLSQRKPAPGRHQVKAPALAVSEHATTDEPTTVCEYDAPISQAHESKSFERSDCSPTKPAIPTSPQSVDPDLTPTRLPRSRTTSFIPRPVKSGSDISATDVEGPFKPPPPAVVAQPKPRVVSSKIPTPSPPLSERRRSSPRQYLPQYTSQQAKRVAAISAFAEENDGSPTKVALRSRTTPNLMKTTTSPRSAQPANFVVPRKTGLKRSLATPTAQKPLLQENVPIQKQVTQRRSQIQEKSLRRESLAVPDIVSNRRSFGPGTPLGQSKQPSFATPPVARKRLSSHLAQQTPVTAKRVPSKVHTNSHMEARSQVGIGGQIVQPRLMGPRSPPMPSFGFSTPALPRSSTEKDLQRKTLGTPNGLGGVWRSSRALAVTNHEVRGLPRSYTVHDFGTHWESAPPVPPIPEHYRTPSLSDLTQRLRMTEHTLVRPRPARITSDASSCESIPEGTEEDGRHSRASSTPSQTRPKRSSTLEISDSTNNLPRLPKVPPVLDSSNKQQSAPTDNYGGDRRDNQNKRPWSISERQSSENANVDSFFQVKDYMPPLYWAGRFQSRFDQWRTEAMTAQLNPSHESVGPLGECRLDQEKLAASYIFAQLRDLCTSNQAADSLWVRLVAFHPSNRSKTNFKSRSSSSNIGKTTNFSATHSISQAFHPVSLTTNRLTKEPSDEP